MEITKEYLDEKYSVFENNKEKYADIVADIIGRFDEAISKRDTAPLEGYEKRYEEIEGIRTAETFKLDVVKNILLLEKEHNKEISFWKDCLNCKSLMEHYTKCTLYIRRLEMPLPNALKEEAISYLLTREVSVIAILSILSNEPFEHRDFISRVLYERLCSNLNPQSKLRSLDYFSNYMDVTSYRLNKAFAFLECGERKLACDCLKEIENPKASIAELISKLEN